MRRRSWNAIVRFTIYTIVLATAVISVANLLMVLEGSL
jgi:hypothetical protein